MYREGWKQEEIRVAIDGPSGAHDDDPEQAGDSEPEKVHGHGRQQPAEVRSRAEYYEELRAADKQMAASDGRSDRPPRVLPAVVGVGLNSQLAADEHLSLLGDITFYR